MIALLFFHQDYCSSVKWGAVMSAERESTKLAESTTRGQGMIYDTCLYIARDKNHSEADGGVASIGYACADVKEGRYYSVILYLLILYLFICSFVHLFLFSCFHALVDHARQNRC